MGNSRKVLVFSCRTRMAAPGRADAPSDARRRNVAPHKVEVERQAFARADRPVSLELGDVRLGPDWEASGDDFGRLDAYSGIVRPPLPSDGEEQQPTENLDQIVGRRGDVRLPVTHFEDVLRLERVADPTSDDRLYLPGRVLAIRVTRGEP